MTAVVAAGRRILPRGWRDFGVQIVLWVGFYVSYLVVRSVVDRDPSKAIVNGLRVIEQGLKPGEKVIISGTQFLVDGAPVKPIS